MTKHHPLSRFLGEPERHDSQGEAEPPPEPEPERGARRRLMPLVDLPGAPAPALPAVADPFADRRQRDERDERRQRARAHREWKEAVAAVNDQRDCIRRELRDVKQRLADALQPQSYLTLARKGIASGAAIAGFGAMLLGATSKRAGVSSRAYAGVGAASLAGAVSHGAEVHARDVVALRREVRELERELASCRPPPRPDW